MSSNRIKVVRKADSLGQRVLNRFAAPLSLAADDCVQLDGWTDHPKYVYQIVRIETTAAAGDAPTELSDQPAERSCSASKGLVGTQQALSGRVAQQLGPLSRSVPPLSQLECSAPSRQAAPEPSACNVAHVPATGGAGDDAKMTNTRIAEAPLSSSAHSSTTDAPCTGQHRRGSPALFYFGGSK
jgi:hypothetical protein